MIVPLAKFLPFSLGVMLGIYAIQQCAAAAILCGGLLIFLFAVLGVVLVALTITNTAGGAIFLALLIVVSEVFALIGANVIPVLLFPIALVRLVLILAPLTPRAAALGTPGVAPIFVANINSKRLDRLGLIAFLTRFHLSS